MAESIFKKHQLDITVDVELNDAQRKATNVKIKNMANEWQDLLDDAIKQGIEQGAKSASLKDVLTQFNAQLKAFKLEPLTITVDELQVMDKPIEHAAKLVIQKLGDSFKGGGLGNIISEEITDSLNVLSGTVDKIYQKMERGAKKSALNIAKSMREIEEAASRYTKKGDMKTLDSVLRVGVTSGKAQKNAQGFYEKSVSTAQSDASWDQKYAADVAFVRNYEALDEKLRKEVFGAQLVEVEKYYAKLAAVHQDKMTALNNILAQNDYIGAQKTKNPVKYQFKGIEPWAQEKTLQEIKNILSGGLTVKGDNNGSSGDGAKPESLNTKKPPVTSTPEVKPKKTPLPQPKVQQPSTMSDTSAFNQKLFNAIEKLSNDIETAFKSMINEDIDEDQFDDQLSELRGEFLKQFKFDNKQNIDDYLAEKSDNMGEWNSKKIYDRLSKKLSPEDSSWPRIETPIVDSADTQVIAEQNEELEKQAEIIELINSLISSKSQKEKFAYLNTQTGDASRYIEGEYDSVSGDEARQLRNSDNRNFDSTLHTHPTKVAVPSPEDFKDQYLKNFDNFKKNFILATDEIAEIDFSQLTEQQAKDIYDKYNKQVIAKEKEYPSLKDIGVESVDINSTWTELEKQLNAVLPTMSDAVRSYIEDLKQTISADSALNTSVDDIHDILNEKAAEHFQDQDASIDASGIAEQVFDQTTGEIDAVQRMNRDILVQAIKDLGYDVSQIFRTYSIQDFVQQVQPVQGDTNQRINVEADVYQQNTEAIKQEVAAEKELNQVESQNPPAQDDTSVHKANVEAINKGIEAYKQYNIERMSQGDITSLYWAAKHPETHDGELEAALQSNPNLISELTAQRDDLQGKLQPIQEMANKISQMSSIKDIPFDQLRQEAINVGQRLSTMYDQGITDTEEYIALQYKLIKIIDQIGVSYGGVKGSGAKDTSELRRWVRNSIESEFGKDPVDEKVVEALWGQGKFSIMKTNAQTFNQRDMAGRLLGTDEIFVKSDSDDLSEINLIIEALSKISPIANTAKTSIDGLNDSLQEKEVIENSDNNGAEIAAEKAETDAINQQNEALKENIDLKERANEPNIETVPKTEPSADITNVSADSIEVKASIEPEELRGLLDSITYKVQVIQNTELTDDNKVSINVDELKSVLDGITYNVKFAHEDADKGSNKISIDESTLETVLKRITYDVKIAHDDADKTANKIAIDESALEGTLNRVFGNILTPKDGDKKPEGKKEPWALESTLNTTIKGVLDQIQTNTARIGQVPQTPANDSDSTLTQISKNVSEINSKVVKGSKVTTKDTVKVTKASQGRDAQILTERIATQKLALAKFKTELETSGRMTEDVAKKIRGLAISLGMVKDSKGLTKWGQKFQQQKLSVGITDLEGKEEKQLEKDALKEQEIGLNKIAKLEKEIGKLRADADVATNEDVRKALEEEIQLRQQLIGLIKQSSAEDSDDSNEYIAYHGTKSGGFKNYDMSKTQAQDALFFTDDRDVAKTYSDGVEKDIDLDSSEIQKGIYTNKLTINNPYIVDAQGKNWDEIGDVQGDTNSAYNIGAKKFGDGSVAYQGKIWDIGGEQHNVFGDEANVHKIIAALYDPDTADVIIARLKKQQEIQDEKFEQGLIIDANDTFRYNREKNQYPNNLSNLVAEMAFAKGHDGVIFKNMVDSGGGDGSRAPSTVYAVRDASQAQIVDPATIQDDKNNALEEEVSLRDRILEKQKQGLELDAQEEAYYRQMAANHTKQAKANAKQDAKDIEDAFKEQEKETKKQATAAKKLAQREAMLGKAGSAVGRAETTWMNAVGIEGLPPSFVADIDEYYNKLDALRKKHQELKNSDMISEEQKNELIKQTMEINKMTDEIGELVSEYQKLSGDNATVIGTNTLGANAGLSAYEQQLKQTVMTATNGKAQIKNFDATTRTLTYTVKTGKNEFTEYTAAVRRADGALVSVQGTTKRTETFIEATKRKMKEISSYMSGMSLISRLGQELRRGIQYVREIDLALTELKKVTDETEEEYDQFLQTASKVGARLGSTISAVTEATATFAKLGYGIEQATEMAEAAIVYKNVGDNIASTEDAADSIISTLKGFGLEASESMEIVDRFNEVGNRFAITSQGIGEALRLSASALNEGGNSLDEAIGLITAANEVVNDPSSVGTALKTLTLRLRGSKTELEEMGEDVSDMATTTSQLQAKLLALTGGKVDIMLDENTFKNSTQILREMADAWEGMNDIQRASALELMGGKRQANVLSALIQNFDTVESVIETSANSAGSALQENEKYLDSIQGKIDQFNNAMQTLWSNLLDSDVVKGFVEWGTKIIKSLDTVKGKFLAILKVIALFMAYKKINPLDWVSKISGLFDTIKNTEGGVKQFIGSLLGIAPAMKVVTAETVANTLATQTNDAVKTKQIMSEMGLAGATGTLSAAQKEQAAAAILNAMSTGQLTMAQGNAILAMLGYAGATVAADGSLKALDKTTKSFMASNPIGWILLIVSALMSVVMWISNTESKVDKLKDKLSDTKSEVSDIKDRLDSLNSELETTRDRIAELTSMPSLSFVEQEELNNLIKYNDELERNKKIEEGNLKSAEALDINAKEEYIEEVWDSEGFDKAYYYDNGVIREDEWDETGINTKDALDKAIEDYEDTKRKRKDVADLLENPDKYSEYEKYAIKQRAVWDLNGLISHGDLVSEDVFNANPSQYDSGVSNDSLRSYAYANLDDTYANIASGINMVLGDEEFKDLSYGQSDKIDAFLDEYYAYQLKWQRAQGLDVGSEVITSMFDKTSSEKMQKLGKELQEIANNDSLTDEEKADQIKARIDNIDKADEAYRRLNNTMTIVGVTAQDIADYFILEGVAFDSNTIEGVSAQYQKGIDALEKFKDGQKTLYEDYNGNKEEIGFDDLFELDAGSNEWKAIDTQISKVLKGADETTRKEFGHLVETIKNEEINFDNAIESFGLSGVQRGLKLIEASVIEINTNMFKDLDDDLNGLIDTFGELGSALESVANSFELLQQANKEMNHSGHLSIETALQLIESTEDWNDVLTISNGVITLNGNATDALINSKLNQIRTNIELEIKELETARAQAVAAESGENLGVTLEESTNESIRQVAANLGYLTELLAAFSEGDWSNAFSRASDAKNSSLESTKVAKSEKSSKMTVAEIDEKLEDAYARRGIMDGVTADNFESSYYSGIVDGSDTDSKTSEADDAFQRAMEYWENRIAANQARYEQIQSEIDLLESKGQKADASYYEEQIQLENERLSLLQQQKAEAQSFLGTFAEGSDEWWEVASQLNDIEGEIDSVTASIQDLNDAIAEVNWYKFEEPLTRFDNHTDTVANIRDLIAPNGEEDWFDDEGMWTEKGVAVAGTYVQEIEMDQQSLDEVQALLNDKLSLPYEGNEAYYKSLDLSIDSEQDLYDKREEYQKKEQGYVKDIKGNQQNLADMYEAQIDAVEEYTQTLVDGYNDYIDSVKEALDAERDLYEFKKNVQKQSKDIAEIERRIASLSGSTNKADIAERRKLEAQLYESRESLNDTYYDHAKDAQSEALDAEAAAYEETMTKFIEKLRESLDTALLDMDTFMKGVYNAVILNAPTILEEYGKLGIALDAAITDPWIAASSAIQKYQDGDGKNLGLSAMNSWINEGGVFPTFKSGATEALTSPWGAGQNAIGAFKTSVDTQMGKVVEAVNSNVSKAKENLSKLYKQIEDTEKKAASTKITPSGGGGGNPEVDNRTGFLGLGLDDTTTVKLRGLMKTSKEMILGQKSFVDANTETINGVKYYRDSETGYYYKISDLNSKRKYDGGRTTGWSIPKGTWFYTKHAQGTTGTTRDEWAITDEPQFGDELTMYATPEGTLSFMRAGSTVIPADLTRELIDLPNVVDGLINRPKFDSGINMIANAINKPEIVIDVENFLKVDRVDKDSLPQLEAMMDKKIDTFAKQLNYSIKKFAR